MARSCVLIFAALFAVAFSSARSIAQPDPALNPTFGSIDLKAGFKPDPFKKDVSAGGRISTNLGGVNGNISKAPEFRLNYTAGKAPLTFEVSSKGETTLLIRQPDGKWIANGDGVRGQIVLTEPQSGRYDIYVGTVGKDTIPATIVIAEAPLAPLVGKGNLPDCYVLSAGVNFFITQNNLRGCQNDAKDIAAAFKKQAGTVYRKVDHETLLAESATRANILERFQKFSDRGNAGDFFVLSLAGHGGDDKGYWFFTPFDFSGGNKHATSLVDEQLLSASVKLMKQKKKVVILADACHSGMLIANAKIYLEKHKDALEGGLVLMVACGEKQEACAYGENGAFTKAFVEAMTPLGDLDGDGKITLGEIRQFATKRNSELAEKVKHKQDGSVVWFGSLSKDTPLAVAKPLAPLAKAFEAPKLPKKFGTVKWNVAGLESRFAIVKCQPDPAQPQDLVFELDLKEDIPQKTTCQLVLTDSDGVKTKYLGNSNPYTGKLGGRFVLTFINALSDYEKDKWSKAVEVTFTLE